MMRALVFATVLIPTGASAQQGFTCSYGDRGACLGYSDTVCSSGDKCVNSDASCFSNSQCNYEGFTCQSNVTECTEEYEGLLTRFNSLVNDYNELLDENQDMRVAFQSALEDLEETQEELADTQGDYRRSEQALVNLQSCIEGLGRFDDPATCLP